MKRKNTIFRILIAMLMFSFALRGVPLIKAQAAQIVSPLTMVSGNLQVGVTYKNSGLELTRIFDSSKGQELLASVVNEPLFKISLNGATIDSKQGWSSVSADYSGSIYTFVFSGNADVPGVTATIKADMSTADAIKWSIAVNNTSSSKYIQTIQFPNIPIRDLGTGRQAIYPFASGSVGDFWTSGGYGGWAYPSCVCSMPWVAAYNGKTGLYLGWHANIAQVVYPYAENGGTKVCRLGLELPVPDDTKAGNDFSTTASALMQLTPGWYDAAMIYRNWAKSNASWFPTIDGNGRTDSPDWFKKLNVWTKTENTSGETPADTTALVEAFQKYMGMPVGNHWYRWHDCLMDGHFPQYFPPKNGFAENVAAQKNNNIYVMPYVNGRLWSSTIPSFDSEGARAAASKDSAGALYTENDDQPNEFLATMCSTQTMWQNKVKSFSLDQLMNTYHVNGVYEDMVGYSGPSACYDASHGHTLGIGGDYWQKGYEKMYNTLIRPNMPAGTILATEGAADSSAKMFDAELAYIFSNTGMDGVPALHAVVANATQLMGRYYANDESDLQWKQKNGRAFVWGEQLGWCDADIIKYPSKATYLKNTAKVRDQINRSIYAGQMGRPLVLGGNATVTGPDITTNAVENGVWMLPQDNKVVVLLTNVSDAAKTVTVNMDLSQYGLSSTSLNIDELGPTGRTGTFTSATNVISSKSVKLAAGEVKAWVITAGGSIPITQYYTISDRWMSSFLYDNKNGKVNYGGTATTDYYKWSLETKDGYTQLKNKATGNYMSVENQLGYVECTAVEPGWWSKDWTLTDMGDSYKQIRSRWQPTEGIHVENQMGYAEYGAIDDGMWSAQFKLTAVNQE